MCDSHNPASDGGHPDRRAFLKRSTIAAAAGLLGISLGSKVAYADALTREQRWARSRLGRLSELWRGPLRSDGPSSAQEQ